MPELTEEEKKQLFFHIISPDQEKPLGMNNEELMKYAETLTHQLEVPVREYLSLNLIGQIERIRNDIALWQEKLDLVNFGKKKKKKLSLKIVEILDRVKADLVDEIKQVEKPEEYVKAIEDRIKVLIHSQVISGQFDAFFRFMFVQALIGNTSHVLAVEYRQKLKAEFDLIQPANFKNALFEILNPVFLIPKEYDDIKNFWTENRSLELLAKYNRLKLIIEYVRRALKKDRSRKQELQQTFGISDDWIDLVDSTQNVKDLALEWALKLMDIEKQMAEFYSLRKSKRKVKNVLIDLSFEHLHNRILRKARRYNQTEKMLVYCTFYGGSRQIGGIDDPKSPNVALLKVEDWTHEESYFRSIFSIGIGSKYRF